jgi:murein DD-endopeptidase MepM/ murein hydrolase activator NlpD
MRSLRAHPRWSALAAVCLATGLVTGLSTSTTADPNPEAGGQVQIPSTAGTQPAEAELVEVEGNGATADHRAADEASVEPAAEPPAAGVAEDEPAMVEPAWAQVEVQPGQTMEKIFRGLGLGAGLLHEVVYLDDRTRTLVDIRPGDRFAFDIDADGAFRALRAEFDEQHWLFVERRDEQLSSRLESRAIDRRVVEASGTITNSLFNAAKAAGLSDNMTMRLANIFGWDVDFALDIRAGDRFALVYEQIWRDGEFLRDGPILAARFVNRGDSFEAVRFDAGNGPDYFAPDGRPMRKAFLRAPLNFSYVTSNFNPRRFHPVTRRIRPHNGTDYGAPVGTPVWASGDGRVIESAYNNLNGHYVFIQHGNNIVTKYLHLSRRQVSRGDRVRQGQTIGRVGATGRVTGAHLHYEFLLNGVHRNPRTVDLPPADPLPEEYRERFVQTSNPLLARLEAADPSGLLLARRPDDGCGGAASSC